MNPSQFVKESRIAFKGKWADSFVNALLNNFLSGIILIYYTALLYIVLLPLGFIRGDQGFNSAYNLFRFFQKWHFSRLGVFEILFLLILIMVLLVHSIIINKFNLLRVKYNLGLVNGQSRNDAILNEFKALLNPKSVFSIFLSQKHFYLALIPTITILIYTLMYFIGSILFVIPGIIVALGLSMLSFLIAENPTAKPISLIKKSWNLMLNHKMSLFKVILYSIPLILIGVVTCGIGFIWVVPFLNFLMARFYINLEGNKIIPEEECMKLSNDDLDLENHTKISKWNEVIACGSLLLPMFSWLIMTQYYVTFIVLISLIYLKFKKLNKLFIQYLPIFSGLTILSFSSLVNIEFSESSNYELYAICYNLLNFSLVLYTLILYFQFFSLLLTSNIHSDTFEEKHVKGNFYKYFRWLLYLIIAVCVSALAYEKLTSEKLNKNQVESEQNQDSQVEPINENTSEENNNQELDNGQNVTSEVKTIKDLINYGEFESTTNGYSEKLFFNFNSNNELIVEYSTRNGRRIMLNVKKDSNGSLMDVVYFSNKPNELYQILNIRQDHTQFEVVNPDNSRQIFNAIEH
jgi:hypothetical protein